MLGVLQAAFYLIVFGTLAWLAWSETRQAARRRRDRADLARCGGRVTYPTSAPRWDGGPRRCDPTPPGDYGWRAISEGMEQT